MGTSMMSEGWNALVDELKTLEAFFPLLGSPGEQDEVLEEIAELEELIAAGRRTLPTRTGLSARRVGTEATPARTRLRQGRRAFALLRP